jgi:ABC-type Zn uptake system ZnuABC Zn-binding protein ZnuA
MNGDLIRRVLLAVLAVAAAAGLAACGSGAGPGTSGSTAASQPTSSSPLSVVAETSFLADIVENVGGDRVTVESLVPIGTDPHTFDPTPRDAAKIAKARAVVINSAGFEPAVDKLIAGAGSHDLRVVDAAEGLAGERVDPHFWLDPIDVITYVENIRDALTAIDPGGATEYAANAAAYERKLRDLDSWTKEQVATIPAARRLLVTNHESLGRFADRYGFKVVGTVFPGPDAEGAPSAKSLGALITEIRAGGVPAIFLETGSNPDLADQVARETGVKVITDLYTHSLAQNAPTYLDMMKWNVEHIVEALR